MREAIGVGRSLSEPVYASINLTNSEYQITSERPPTPPACPYERPDHGRTCGFAISISAAKNAGLKCVSHSLVRTESRAAKH